MRYCMWKAKQWAIESSFNYQTMTYEKFKEVVELQIAHHKKIQALYKLKVDLIEAFDEQNKANQLLWQEVLTEFGYDWLSWYLYEKDGISGNPRAELSAWDEEKNEICKDIKSLWKYLTKEKYFKIQLLVCNRVSIFSVSRKCSDR